MNETATILRLLKKGSSTRLLSIPTSGASPAVSGAERLWNRTRLHDPDGRLTRDRRYAGL